MLKELKKHKLAYLILLIVLILGLILFLGAWPDNSLQCFIAIGIALFYFIWGLVTHLQTGKLTRRIFFEYLIVSVIAGLLMVLITL